MSPSTRRQGGFTFLWLMFLVASLGVGLAALGTVWHTAVQREKEAELLYIGDQYRRAIESFWAATPGTQKQLPKTLDELLQDPRFPNTVRHLRRLYPDPVTGRSDWGLVRDANGGISGVQSRSEQHPIKTGNFPARFSEFAGKDSYQQWIFSVENVKVESANPVNNDAKAQGTEEISTSPLIGQTSALKQDQAPDKVPATATIVHPRGPARRQRQPLRHRAERRGARGCAT
ncbi:MAG TPA: type II secretion system protein [Thiobacillaceae bacterium]|nr:type II secretion system protein [Thiobacillaceae bacterium]